MPRKTMSRGGQNGRQFTYMQSGRQERTYHAEQPTPFKQFDEVIHHAVKDSCLFGRRIDGAALFCK